MVPGLQLRQKIPNCKDVVGVQLLLGGPVQTYAHIRYRFRVPPGPDLPHAVMVRNRSTGGEDFVTRVALDGFVDDHRVGEASVVEPEVEVHARTGIVGLRHPAGHEVVFDVVFGTFLRG